jgi:glycosyltransferase involved in cell wall biosynthesis
MTPPTVVAHLTASTLFGGPERQMLGLARSLPAQYRSVFVSFREGGRCSAFLDEARRRRFEGVALCNDTPHFRAAITELSDLLRRVEAGVLCCHGYKANLLGRFAARRCGVPVVAVSRGWTGENLKVRLYEALDRLGLRWMDRVVCVSEAQAGKVRRAGVPAERTLVIRNAIDTWRFEAPAPHYRQQLHAFFSRPRTCVIGAAGRLSPEKGFGVLVEAAARIVPSHPSVGFLLFGDGVLREQLADRIAALGLRDHFVLAGFRSDLDRFVPFFDVLALPSFTEGMPNVVLEAMAASVPVVATAVGGTPELLDDGVNGYLVPPGNPEALAGRLLDTFASEGQRRAMGLRGRERVSRDFTFAAQSLAYQSLFQQLQGRRDQRVAA